MIEQRDVILFVLALVCVSVLMAALHDRHYRKRRDVVRDARLRAIEDVLPADVRHKLLEARVAAHEEILLEDETT